MISNSTSKAPEKTFNFDLQGTLFNGIFYSTEGGAFQKEKNAPSCGGHLIFR
jgi:hypothetical protein